jgi:hypothetical protein
LSLEIAKGWERVDGLHFGGRTSWVCLAADTEGNLVAFSELVVKGLPSQVVPRIIEAREKAGCDADESPYAGPAELLGPREYKWGALYRARDEFADLGLPLAEGNEDPVAGRLRIAELLRPDEAHWFPEWHPRAGEADSPRLFVRDSCRRLREQLSSAPLAADGERAAHAAVQAEWEQADGGLVAALRYAVMSRPSPSELPKEEVLDMRQRAIQELVEARDNPRPAVVGEDYIW